MNKEKILKMDNLFPYLINIYEEFLKSDDFKRMINSVKSKNDEEYLKLFFRHTKNFLNLYIKDRLNKTKIRRKLSVKVNR
jgi:hypothetical protein